MLKLQQPPSFSTELTAFLFSRLTEEQSSGVPTTRWGRPHCTTWVWTPPASTLLLAVRTAASGERVGVYFLKVHEVSNGKPRRKGLIFEVSFPSDWQGFQHQQWQTEETVQGIPEWGWQSAQGNVFLRSQMLRMPFPSYIYSLLTTELPFVLAGSAWSVRSICGHQLLR